MKARVKSTDGSIVISIDGKVDYESQDQVCATINHTIERNKKDQAAKKIIVNFKNLEFVGSSGITQFVQSLKQIHHETDVTPKYCGVRSEFQKIIKAFDEENQFDFYEDDSLAKRSGKTLLNQ
ncbi:MAG: STAS domain-containing protein [Bdellovibrionales bacterium]|nr:STAS domain-containing protein [Oligoflexia bacterium]